MRHQAIYKLYPEAVSITEEYDTKDINGNLLSLDDTLIDAEVVKIQKEAQLKKLEVDIGKAVLNFLDAQCLSLGFNGDSTTQPYRAVANYVGFDNVYRTDAELLGAWIALVFQKSEQIKADILNGIRALPTVDEVISELPIY